MDEQQTRVAMDLSKEAGKLILEALLHALPMAALYSLLLLALSVVIVVLVHRRKLYHRKLGAWNLLAKLHYPVCMLVFAILGFALGLVASFQTSADRALDEKLQPVLVGVVGPLQQKVIQTIPPELAESGMTGEEIYNHLVEKFAQQAAAEDALWEGGRFSKLGRGIELLVRRHMIRLMIDEVFAEAGIQAGLGENGGELILDAFMSTDFSKRSDEIAAEATDFAKKHVAATTNGLRLNAVIFSGAVLLLLLIDPLIYYKFWLPRSLRDSALEPVA